MTDETNPFHSMIAITRDENSPLSFGRSGDNPPYVFAFQLKCRNTWDKPLEIREAKFSSANAGFSSMEGVILWADLEAVKNPIRPEAEFILIAKLPPMRDSGMENGLFLDDFRKQFASFSAQIILKDGSYGYWVFPADEVEAMLAAGEKSVARK